MLPETEIRLLTDRDAETYWRLRLEALERDAHSFGESAEEHRQITVESTVERLAGNPDQNFVYGAFVQGELIGMAGFFRYGLSKARHKGRIWGVYVRQSCRGQGLGRALLSALLQKIRACPDVEQIVLTVVADLDAAKGLYQSLGFKTYGVEPRGLKLDGAYFDVEHMQLTLE